MTARLLAWRIAAIAAAVLPAIVGVPASPATAADVATVTCEPVTAESESPAVPLTGFTPITPRRLVDTRTGLGGATPLQAGCTLRLDMAAAGFGTDAEAFALSLTAISADRGFLSVHPCAGGRRGTSNLNSRAGFPTPNLAIARPDTEGRICVLSSRETDVVVDVTGWWTFDGESTFTSVPPRRVPARLAIVGGTIVERLWDRIGRTDDPPMTGFLAEQLSTAHWFDQRRTREALDWSPAISLAEGFDRLADWYRSRC